MKILYLFVIITFSISCISHTELSNHQTKSDSLRNTLIGKWGGLGNKPTFQIKQDSIYFFEQSTAYSYKIINHDMVIHYPQIEGVLRNIYVLKDTLFFSNEEGVQMRGFRKK